jgi:hypothetical protein
VNHRDTEAQRHRGTEGEFLALKPRFRGLAGLPVEDVLLSTSSVRTFAPGGVSRAIASPRAAQIPAAAPDGIRVRALMVKDLPNPGDEPACLPRALEITGQ